MLIISTELLKGLKMMFGQKGKEDFKLTLQRLKKRCLKECEGAIPMAEIIAKHVTGEYEKLPPKTLVRLLGNITMEMDEKEHDI